MLRIAVQSKGRLYEDTMALLAEADIKVSSSKRTLLVQSSNFPVEVLYLRDDDIPQSVAGGVADLGIVGENEFTPSGLQQVPPFVGHTQGCGLFRPFLVRRQEDSHFLSQYPEKIHEGKRGGG